MRSPNDIASDKIGVAVQAIIYFIVGLWLAYAIVWLPMAHLIGWLF